MSRLGKRSGPPTGNVPQDLGIQAEAFNPRVTRAKTSQLSGVGVRTGSHGRSLSRIQAGGEIVSGSRPSTTAALTRQLGSVPYTEAVSQFGDPVHQARVTAAWHIRDSRLRSKDFNSDGCLAFLCESHNAALTLNSANNGRYSLLATMKGAVSPLGAVDMFTPPEVNFLLACETMEVADKGCLPSPAEVMADFKFMGFQYNQNGGMEAGGTPSPFSGSNKQVNVIVHGDSQGKNYWGPGLVQGDSLYMVISREARKLLAAERQMEFVLDPVTGTVILPGENTHYREKQDPQKRRRRLVDYPCHLSFITSPNNTPPDVPMCVDDNGVKHEPYFIYLGRFNYYLDPPSSGFSTKRASVDAREVMHAGLINMTFVQDHGLQ